MRDHPAYELEHVIRFGPPLIEAALFFDPQEPSDQHRSSRRIWKNSWMGKVAARHTPERRRYATVPGWTPAPMIYGDDECNGRSTVRGG
jgi:hypothetical protein